MPSKTVIVTTTTFYEDPEGKDKVRFDLACELTERARDAGHFVVIVDGSPKRIVEKKLRKAGAFVFKQLEKGMGPSRRQVWREAGVLVTGSDTAILWTEEKPDIVRFIPEMVDCMYEKSAAIVIPSRSLKSWESYPRFQRESEQTANLVYNNLFPSSDGPFDPMFGPVLFNPVELADFVEMDWRTWYDLPDTYIQHYVPIFSRASGSTVASVEVDFVYPRLQRIIEEEGEWAMEMLEKRLLQMKELIGAYFILRGDLLPL